MKKGMKIKEWNEGKRCNRYYVIRKGIIYFKYLNKLNNIIFK